MAMSIELRVNGVVVDGVEAWWDDVELALDGHEDDYPLLCRVDAYGVVDFEMSELPRVFDELQHLRTGASPALTRFIEKLEALSLTGLAADGGALRFRGD